MNTKIILSERIRSLYIYLLVYISILLIFWLDCLTGSEISFSIFYLIPITFLTWYLGVLPAVVTSVACAVLWFFADHISGMTYSSPLTGYWNATVRLCYFLIATMVVIFLKRRAELKTKMAFYANEEQLRNLASHIQQIREEERQRIAREIHDELGHALTELKLEMAWLGKRIGESEKEMASVAMLEKVSNMSSLIDATIKRVRKISSELRPGILDALGLFPAMEWQLDEQKRKYGLSFSYSADIEEIQLKPARATALFRIFQEIMNNVVQHSDATEVTVKISKAKNNIVLEAKDNGRGIAREQIESPNSLGLLGIRERALFLGGAVEFSGKPGIGTKVVLTVPIT